MKSSIRVPLHRPVEGPRPSMGPLPREEGEDPFVNRPCYEFNQRLGDSWNDRRCDHCRHYLTARCPHIDEFLDDVEDLSPE